jgi:hypothetical protein
VASWLRWRQARGAAGCLYDPQDLPIHPACLPARLSALVLTSYR